MSNSKNRFKYLKKLAKEYGLPLSVVLSIAAVVPESEDYDFLLEALEDYRYIYSALAD